MAGCLGFAIVGVRTRLYFVKPSRTNLGEAVANDAYRAKSQSAAPCRRQVMLQSQSIDGHKTFYHAARLRRLVWSLRRFGGVPI